MQYINSMNNFYLARITNIEKIPTNREGVYNTIIYVTPEDSVTDGGERKAYTPSLVPYTEVGSGFMTVPQSGALCVVMYRPNSEYDQIITYTPNEAIGSEGVYNPENLENNEMCIKAGGLVKSLFKIAPEGKISLYSNPFSFIKLDGKTRNLDITTNTAHNYYPFGYELYNYNNKHYLTDAVKVAEYKNLLSKAYEAKISADWDLETEEVNLLGVTAKYIDKVLIRAGTIYNYNSNIANNKALSEIGHVYQIETRQSTYNENDKDTISILRLGYQRANNLKYDENTKYSAGTLFEYNAKRVNNLLGSNSYSSGLIRYGKLESDISGTESENTKGEIFRLQLYDSVYEAIGITGVNPLGIGKGWKYLLNNEKAAEQYTQSFGTLADNSYFRQHLHSYTGLSLNNLTSYSGLSSTFILGGDYDVFKEYNVIQSGNITNTFTNTIKNDQVYFENLQVAEGKTQTIQFEKDSLSFKIKINDKLYSININSNGITLEVDTENKPQIIINTNGLIEIKNKNKNLKNIIQGLLDAINLATYKTSQGPTLPGPINASDFTAVSQDLANLLA